MKFKKSMVWVVALAAMPLASCIQIPASSSAGSSSASSTAGSSSSQGEASSSSSSETTSSSEESSSFSYDLSKKVTLNMSVMYQTASTRMKFSSATKDYTLPYSACDGNTYEDGDFKPVWAALQKNLNFTINDDTSASATTVADAFKTYQTAGFTSNNELLNIAQGSSTDIIAEGTKNKTILDLSKYLDKMPNFKAFLDANPVVQKTIVDASGAMYYAPYFDGFNDIERMLLVRWDWVEKLLDGDTPTTLDTAKTITANYTAFTPESLDVKIKVMNAAETGVAQIEKKHTANIITTQNALTTMNGDSLVKALRSYIDTTYAGAYGTTRSQLFCGYRSAYDVDELVALYRCVLANPGFLVGDTSKTLVPLYPREYTNDRTADLWRFTQFFGVRGGESRNGYFYVDKNGKIEDSRETPEMKNALKKLNQMYAEGLILQNFTSKTAVSTDGKYENYLQKNNLGFSTYDYEQTQTVYNDATNANHPSGATDYLFASILPAVADWRGDGNYFHYTESWRSVKTEGWFITAETASDSDKLSRALALFDYLYSTEGNRLMSYGPDAYLAKTSAGAIKTMAYQGKDVPVLSDDCKAELKSLAAGNYTNYYRYYLGATYPVGYVKQQGMEYQTVSTAALPALDDINNAITLGVLEHVNFSTENEDHLYDIIPTTFAFNDAEQTALTTNFTDLDGQINNTKGKNNVWSSIVMTGFGAYNSFDFSEANYIHTVSSKDTGCLNDSGYVSYYNDAYARMGL